ncbi:MAG: WD40 repeat domain-containing protein [Deltaproteobacteria bacterium]|nr:WD40 repeat domain-containing protein [Deltaproteobacteria bacterium]
MWPPPLARKTPSAIRSAQMTGELVTAAGADGSVRRWERGAAVGEPVQTRVPSKRAAIAAGGRVVVLAGIDGSVVRVDGETVEVVGSHATKVRGLAVDPSGRRVATGSEDGMIQVWDRETGRHLTLRGHRQRIRHLSFVRDGNGLLSADGEGVVRVWPLDAIPGTFFDDHHAQIEHLAVSPDGRIAVSTDAAGAIVTEDLATGASRPVGHNAAHITAVAVGARGVPITGDVKGIVTWWTGADPVRRNVGSAVHDLATTPDGARVAVATAGGAIALFDAGGTPTGTLAGHTGGTDTIAFDRTGTLLASGGQDRSVRVWRDGAQLADLGGLTSDTHVVRFSPDNATLVAGCDEGLVRAWTVRDGAVDARSHRLVGEHRGGVTAIAFDATSTRVASAARDAGFLIGDLATGTVERATALHRNAIAIAFDATGRVLFASETGDLDHWRPPSAPTTIPVNQGTSAAVALPDGRILLGGTDGSLRAIGR